MPSSGGPLPCSIGAVCRSSEGRRYLARHHPTAFGGVAQLVEQGTFNFSRRNGTRRVSAQRVLVILSTVSLSEA
jgi:hypothetical protein